MSATPLTISDPLEILFKPTRIGGVDLPNRIAMAPMTRAMSPGGVPGENVARYYRRRAEGGVGLVITEGTFIPHPSAGHDQNAPRIYGDDALRGWTRVVKDVHGAGARIFAQLWHVGLVRKPQVEGANVYEEKRSGRAESVWSRLGYAGPDCRRRSLRGVGSRLVRKRNDRQRGPRRKSRLKVKRNKKIESPRSESAERPRTSLPQC
jgi:hypothetical protein